MASFQGEELLEEAAARFREDKPSITDAMKNCLSYILAQDGVAMDEDSASPALDKTELIRCARVSLKHINDFVLPDEAAYAEAHPQGTEETASDRLTTLIDYRVAYRLSNQVKQTSSAKTTQLFGYRFLNVTRCWDDVVEAVKLDLELPPSSSSSESSTSPTLVSDSIVATHAHFLSTWWRSLSREDSIHELIWSSDLKKTQIERAQRRKEEARARLKMMEVSKLEPKRLVDDGAAAGDDVETS